MAEDGPAWIERELEGCRFADERLGRRLRTLLDRMAGAIGGSIPFACQDWANTKAAYRFFANDRVGQGEILGGHVRSTRDRSAGVGGRSRRSTTRPSSPTGGGGPSGSVRPAASTAARTSRAGSACTPSAGS